MPRSLFLRKISKYCAQVLKLNGENFKLVLAKFLGLLVCYSLGVSKNIAGKIRGFSLSQIRACGLVV
jgi:hypothetical protein